MLKPLMIEVVIDACARGQGAPDDGDPQVGHAALGILIYRDHELITEYARALGRRSSNEAEYEALIHAVLLCWASDLSDPVIYSDSKVVVNQVLGHWNCKAQQLLPLLASVQSLQEVFPFRLEHVPRKYVHLADSLAKNFLDGLME